MKKIILLLILFLSSTQVGFSIENIEKVYLNQAIEIAVKNNIDLESEKLNLVIAKNEIKKANRLQNPSIDSFYFYGAAGNSEPRQWGISQNIEIAKRYARKNIAKSNFKLVEKNVEYAIFDLKMDVREAYINLVATKSILDTLEQQKELQEELLEIAQNRVEKNIAKNIDIIQAKIALNQLITQINTAKVNVETALSNFNKVINTRDKIVYDSKDKIFIEENNYEEMLTPNPELKFPEFETIADRALEKRGDLQIAKQEIDLAEKNLVLVAHQKYPDIQISSGYAYMPSAYSDNGNFHNGAYLGASLTNIPLFYNYSPEIQNARLQLEQAELKYLSTKNKAIRDINASYNKFLTARANLKRFEFDIITNSEDLIEMSKKSYEIGDSDITSIIVMKQNYKSIIIGYTQALADYYNSWTNFLREINDENFSINELL